MFLLFHIRYLPVYIIIYGQVVLYWHGGESDDATAVAINGNDMGSTILLQFFILVKMKFVSMIGRVIWNGVAVSHSLRGKLCIAMIGLINK